MLPKIYNELLTALKERIRHTRSVAIRAITSQQLQVYWDIGYTVAELEKSEGWGAKTIERMAQDLKLEFPDIKGLAARSLRYMRMFYEAYPELSILRQSAAELPSMDKQEEFSILQRSAAKMDIPLIQAIIGVPWAHHQVILDRIKNDVERRFYIQKTVENGWSRNILVLQIESDLYQRQGKAITNFSNTLPLPHSDLAVETLKNPYLLDFLGLEDGVKEKDIERALTLHLKDFLLELGRGFLYGGNQFHISVDDKDYFLDLFFYNYNLNCFVIFELKVGEFEPEFAGKLNFYISAVDNKIKHPHHNRTIGVLLCKTPHKTVVQYTLDGMEKPIAVSDYQLAKALPKEIIEEMPTIEEIEYQLNEEIHKLKTATEKRLDSLKEKLASINREKVETGVTFDILKGLYESSFKPMYESLLYNLYKFKEEFVSIDYYWYAGNKVLNSFQELSDFLASEEKLKPPFDINFIYRFHGLKPAGVDTFSTSIHTRLNFGEFRYDLILINYNNHQPFKKKLYTQSLSKEDIQEIGDLVCEQLMDGIERNMKDL